MNNIKCRCHTNIDEGRTKRWPEKMCCRPKVGDLVKAEDGYTLKICGITHDIEEKGVTMGKPLLLIELTEYRSSSGQSFRHPYGRHI